jgi:predicted Zn-dependent protease
MEPPNQQLHNLYTNKGKDLQTRVNDAERLYALGCIDEAILNFRQALRKYPDETAIHLQIAEIQLSMGRVPAAGRALMKANKGKTNKIHFPMEYNRLKQAVKSTQLAPGGISEQAT